MKEIQVALGEKSYWIKIAAGLLAAAGDEIRRVLPQTEKIAVITDSNVAPLYGERLRKSLEMAGFSVTVWEFPAGEESKNLAVLGRGSAAGEKSGRRFLPAQVGVDRSGITLHIASALFT